MTLCIACYHMVSQIVYVIVIMLFFVHYLVVSDNFHGYVQIASGTVSRPHNVTEYSLSRVSVDYVSCI